MKLYNTLTRRVEEIVPIDPKAVSLYTCGPTVYDYYHIGNLRNAVFNDTIRRALESSGLKVHHVMNITDVGHLVSDEDEGEDKLEKSAAREGKTVQQVADFYTKAFKHDMAQLNVLAPNAYKSSRYQDTYARATEFIDDQIALVKELIDKGFAYKTEHAIYFDVAKLESYGQLSGQKLIDKETARKEVVSDPHKHHPYDFAVWFFTIGRYKDHSMHWPSPWGDGFPGWHLECSAIIHATLGDPVDIHTGGVDHIGTHHPNEMAQTEAAFGHRLANYWVHNEFILVDGAKMAKSKGNSYTLKDVTDKGFDPLALRMLYLQSHYRSELNFSWENLEAAQNALKSVYEWADLQFQTFSYEKLNTNYTEAVAAFKYEIINDLKTPAALAFLSGMIKRTEEFGIGSGAIAQALPIIESYLGIGLTERTDISTDQTELLNQRLEARQNKDWVKSDKLRDQLKDQGVGVRDTDHGQVWYRL